MDPLDADIVDFDLPIDDTPLPSSPLPSVEELNASITALAPQLFVPPILDAHPLDDISVLVESASPSFPIPTVEELYASIPAVDPQILIPQFIDTPPHPLSAIDDVADTLSIPIAEELDDSAALDSELAPRNLDTSLLPPDAPVVAGITTLDLTSIDAAGDIAVEPVRFSLHFAEIDF